MKPDSGPDRIVLPLRRRWGIEWQELDDEILVTDVPADRAHLLNSSMAAVWKLCDGTRSADQIAASLAEIFDAAPVGDLGGTVREALKTLAGLDLLETARKPRRKNPAS